jgi:hypothetical protein
MPSTRISCLTKISWLFLWQRKKSVGEMTTLSAPLTKSYPDNSLEKKAYEIAERFKDHLPLMNDRNRLGFNLYRYLKGEGDSPEIIVRNAKFTLAGIKKEELASKLNDEIAKLKDELKS